MDGLVERAHLRPDELQDPEALVPLVFANRLVDSAARASGIPDLGLLATRDVDPLGLGTYGRLMSRSGTVGGVIETSIRLKPAWNSGAQVQLVRRGGEIELHHRFAVARDDSWNQMVAGNLMLHVNLLHLATGRRWRPQYVRLPVPASRAYREQPILADTRVDFDAPWTTIRFPASLLALPLPRRPVHAAMTNAAQRLAAPPQDFVASVRDLVTSLLGMGPPSITLVAEAAAMSVRTLQRRLADQRVTYEQIVAEVRLAEGARWLVESDRKIIDIALELGYSDHANFTRAFRVWTGVTPFDFRGAYRGREPMPATPSAHPVSRTG